MEFLRGRGFSTEEIQKAGLSAQRSRGTGDMFRGRVMIPLQDAQGRVIGFTARLLKDDKNAPKYINTPQTLLYDKSRHVFGLHLAKDAVRRSKFVVISEGQLDVISSHQAGVRQVVATAGTALTEYNLKTLSRFTDDIRLCFDADRAGIAATERAIPIASKVGVTLSVITIPNGKDPDELIKQDKAIWERIITEHQYALDWLMGRYRQELDLESAVGKRHFSDIMLPIVRQLQDSVEQDHYLTRIAEILSVGKEALATKLQKSPEAAKPVQKPVPTPRQLDVAQRDYLRTQDHLLALLFLHPALRPHASLLRREMLATEQARRLFVFLAQNPAYAGDFSQPEAGLSGEDLENISEYAKILVMQHEELYGDVEDLELDYEVARLQARLIEQYIKTQKQRLTARLDGADEATTRDILTRVRGLDVLLKQAQGAQRG
jgi:DNA primase